jgi:ABC-type nitrate/sulfonate/bicarbonate transport system substrate-binding protein
VTDQRLVRIAHSAHGTANSPFSIAESEGYFAQRGLTVERSEVANVAAAIDTLATRSCQIVGAAGAAILAASRGGLDVVVVMSIEARNLFGVIGAAGVTEPAMLRGATIGISRPGAPDHVILHRALREWGMSPEDDVTFAEMHSRGALWAALERGQIAAMATTIPQPIIARAAGLPVLRDFADLNEPYQLGAVVTTRRFAVDQRETVTAFVAAMLTAVDRFRHDPVLAIFHMKARGKIADEDALAKTYAHFAAGMAFSVPDPAALGNVARDYAYVDPAIREVDVDALIDRSFVPARAATTAPEGPG